MEKFTSQNFQIKIIQPKKFLSLKVIVNFFDNVIIPLLVKCEKQPDNGSDRYAATVQLDLNLTENRVW